MSGSKFTPFKNKLDRFFPQISTFCKSVELTKSVLILYKNVYEIFNANFAIYFCVTLAKMWKVNANISINSFIWSVANVIKLFTAVGY